MRLFTLLAGCTLAMAAAAHAETLLTYDLSGSFQVGNTTKTVSAIVTIDPTENAFFFGGSDPSYAFTAQSFTLSVDGSPVTSIFDTFYIQGAGHVEDYGAGAIFRLLDDANGVEEFDFIFPFPFTAGDIGAIQPMPSETAGIISYYLSGTCFTNCNGSAELVVPSATPEPSSLGLLATGILAVGGVVRRRVFSRKGM